jgi:putative nucleotidyltransferase with HDIG domain
MIARKVIQETPLRSFNISELRTGDHLPFDVYIKDKGIVIHYLGKGALWSTAARDDLINRGIKTAYINRKNEALLQEYIEKNEGLKLPNLDDPIAFQRYSISKERHFQIDRSILMTNLPLPFTVYITDNFHIKEFLTKGDRPSEKIKGFTELEGDLLVNSKEMDIYLEHLKGLTQAPDIGSYTKEDLRFIVHKEETKRLMKALLEDPKQGDNIKKTALLINGIIDALIDNKDRVYESLSSKGLDQYTYTHSLNVAILSIRLALEIGLRREQIERLAIGALLHDIGKSVISPDILNKQGRLTANEYKIIRVHVSEGEKILREHKELHEDSLLPLLQHHEKLTGNGYPLRLKGKEIRLFGRIAAIADCYDALTTNRPFRTANTPFYALSILAKEKGDFDPELLRAFIKMLGNVR